MNAATFDNEMIGLGLKSDGNGRFWNESGEIGFAREGGVVSLLNADGYPAMEVTNLEFAVYAAGKESSVNKLIAYWF